MDAMFVVGISVGLVAGFIGFFYFYCVTLYVVVEDWLEKKREGLSD